MLISVHEHCFGPQNGSEPFARDRQFIDAYDAVGIDIAVVSDVWTVRPATPDGFRACNRRMLATLKEFRGRLWGMAYVNSGYQKEALEEIEYCLNADEDCLGVKLYNEYTIDSPVVRPIIEKCIELDVPILEHAGYSPKPVAGQEFISNAGHLAAAAQAYPEAKLICAHIGGGGDWEWQIKTLRGASANLGADTSGSVVDEGMIEMAIRYMGADRLYFGCDMSISAGVGKFRAAKMTDEDREKISCTNFLKLIGRSL